MADESNSNAGLFELSLTLNETLFNGKHYKAAYHALATAYHIAKAAKDSEQLHQVENIARNQSALVNQQSPNDTTLLLYANLAASVKIRAILARFHKRR